MRPGSRERVGRATVWIALVAASALVAGCASGSAGRPADAPSGPAADTESNEGETPSATASGDEGPRTVQPGAPGEATRAVTAEEIAAAGQLEYSEADVRFMRMMIPHHAQALVMTALIPSRTDDRGVRQLGLRMEISQADEIALMERWLRDRGEPLPEWRGPDGAPDPMKLARHRMPGMLTAEQMDDLRAARGVDFERLFLEYMIGHHQGAVDMVATLFASPGGGQVSEVYQFASHVYADQTMEIERMQQMLEARR